VRHLKGRPGGDIGVHGSISVTRTLLAADVVDELRLVIAWFVRRPSSHSTARTGRRWATAWTPCTLKGCRAR
jgi:RibD C-terminal domain